MKKTIVLLIALTIVVAAATKLYTIQAARCTNCKACVEVCPVDAIKPTKVQGKDVQIIDATKCIGCGECLAVCPDGAISVVKPAVTKQGVKKDKK